jgi:negative regulator of flagellin synthesis FlgM
MEIHGKLPAAYIHRIAKQGQADQKVANEQPRPVSGSADRVTLSAHVREMQAARKAIQQLPDVDMEKVANIKAQLNAGKYRIDAKRAAAGMLAESLQINS